MELDEAKAVLRGTVRYPIIQSDMDAAIAVVLGHLAAIEDRARFLGEDSIPFPYRDAAGYLMTGEFDARADGVVTFCQEGGHPHAHVDRRETPSGDT